MMILYVPRWLNAKQKEQVKSRVGRLCKMRPAPVSQRAWATGAHSAEENALVHNVNNLISTMEKPQ